MSKTTATILRDGAKITLTAQPRGAINTDHFAPRLRQALAVRGMTQIGLAAKCGVTPNCVSLNARGKTLPLLEVAANYADALGVSLDWLAVREER
jgi:transcriptional regulator with XRE-family HTH domain